MLNSLESAPGLARASVDPGMSFLFPHTDVGDTVGVSQTEGCQQTIEELGGSTIFETFYLANPSDSSHFITDSQCEGIIHNLPFSRASLIHCRNPLFFTDQQLSKGVFCFFRNKYPTTNKYLSRVNFVASNENCSNTIYIYIYIYIE